MRVRNYPLPRKNTSAAEKSSARWGLNPAGNSSVFMHEIKLISVFYTPTYLADSGPIMITAIVPWRITFPRPAA